MAKLFLNRKLGKWLHSKSVLKQVSFAVEAAVIGSFWGICRLMPVDKASEFGADVFGTLGPRLEKTILFKQILRFAFADLNPKEIQKLERKIWRNLGAIIAEYAHLAAICSDSDRIGVEVPEALADNIAGKRGSIFVAAHQANWEVAAAMPARYGLQVTVVYSELSNPLIDRMLRRRRLAMGCRLVERNDSMRDLVGELRQGRSVGMIVDNREDSGTPIAFLGAPKLTTLAPARLALKLDVDLIPVRIIRIGPARYKVTAEQPVSPKDPTADTRSQAIDMMTQVNMHFDHWIRQRPHEWFCGKRPWAKDLMRQQGGTSKSTVALGI